ATTGSVLVSVGGDARNGLSFPTRRSSDLTLLAPTTGAVGVPVTITGTNFGATQGTSSVSFNGTAATPTSWSATSIVVPVPGGATAGRVTRMEGGDVGNADAFTWLATTTLT